jgi:hypothetical protein
VAYWLGPQADPERVTDVVQPVHLATAHHYEVDSAWVTGFLLRLRADRLSVRAQVHTHPGPFVRHSPTDDAFALAPSEGFLSLVLPFFAMGSITLAGSYAALITSRGWADVDPGEVISWI